MRRALALVIALLGCSGERDSSFARKSSAVLGGVDDTTHTSVVALRSKPDAPRATFCSATAIAQRAVLTAAHCVQGFDVATLSITTGPIAKTPERTIDVESAILAPSGTDLAIVRVVEDLALPIVPLARAAPTVGARFTLVGYGLSLASDLETRGMRRVGEVSVSEVCSLLLAFGDDAINACHGDSGGPLLDGAGAVAAVVSSGRTAQCDPPTYAVRVDAYAGWIDNVLADRPAAAPPPGNECSSTDAGVDAESAPAVAGAGGCATGRASRGSLVWLLALVALRRRYSGACSRS